MKPENSANRRILYCGHGRIETRTHYLVTDLGTLSKIDAWKGLTSIGLVIAKRENKATKKVSVERRYYIIRKPCLVNLFDGQPLPELLLLFWAYMFLYYEGRQYRIAVYKMSKSEANLRNG